MNFSLLNTIFAILAIAVLPGCLGRSTSPDLGTTSNDGTVTLFAAASTGHVLDEIVADFNHRHDVTVQSSFAASSMLAQQITNGAGADVFISANESWVDFLEEKQLVARRQNLLGNRLVIVVPADSKVVVAKPEDLLAESVRHVALAEPEAVPVGIYARRTLEQLGLWNALEPKVAVGADVRRVLAFVETGAAEAGIVYATDAAVSDRVRVAVQLDPKLIGPIRYPAVLLARGVGRPGAESFYRYLASPEATQVFRKHGFTVFDSDTSQRDQRPRPK